MRSAVRFATLLVLALAILAGCAPQDASTNTIYVDATRGCEDPEGPVALWSAPGAVAAGAEVVVEVPHGTRLEIMEQAEQYGVPYYEVEYDGVTGWLPANYSETIPPVCE
jgi:hypothetical protein